MAVDHIRYDLLAQEALRGVVRRVLGDVAKSGLPGEHHFYISFDTSAEGVRISPRMREQYPEEITIILQHQFWDLKVGEEGFEVGLSFSGVPERLIVPFSAIRGFFDPSVQFGLQFETVAETSEDAADDASEDGKADLSRTAKTGATPQAAPPAAHDGATSHNTMSHNTTSHDALPAADAPDRPMAEVVRLDRFRKK